MYGLPIDQAFVYCINILYGGLMYIEARCQNSQALQPTNQRSPPSPSRVWLFIFPPLPHRRRRRPEIQHDIADIHAEPVWLRLCGRAPWCA